MNKLLAPERRTLLLAAGAVLITSTLNLSAPAVMAHAIDGPLRAGDYRGVINHCALLLVMYLITLNTQYRQTLWMGSVGQRTVFRLRGQVFGKLQELPVAFFDKHQAGDLISRMNNDTDKMNQFFSQSLVQFVGSFVTMLGSAFFLLGLNPRLGVAALLPAVVMFAITRALSPWIRRRNASNLKSTGEVSAEISESLAHFKVVVAFDRRDFFRRHFAEVNEQNFRQALRAGVANGALTPIYALCSQMGQLIVLSYGLSLIARGELTIGLLISYFVYLNRFYDPMRQLAALWATFQGASAAYDRISEVLADSSELPLLPAQPPEPNCGRLEFRKVTFGYLPGQVVLREVDFCLQAGKTYAFVGPTGGGKTTTASLMARLYDPVQGTVLLDGRDLRTCTAEERSEKIGFILQEPFLFAGTVGDNVSSLEGLESLFPQGLDTPVEGLSLGQRQVVAFLRAILRKPELLILDEATANIDTVTEEILAGLLRRLPQSTTRVVIAHRLNTIENADAILFVNGARVQLAGSMEQAVALLREEARQS
jgi:ATP-binding cassette subfamily B protein